MHPPGAHVLKSVHPAAKMCTQGAGCTLNFEHWKLMHVLLPTGSEERAILGVVSIPVAIPPSCKDVKNIAL